MGMAPSSVILQKNCPPDEGGGRETENLFGVALYSAISFKPQKVCTTMVTPCTDRFSSHSFKQFTLWP